MNCNSNEAKKFNSWFSKEYVLHKYRNGKVPQTLWNGYSIT